MKKLFILTSLLCILAPASHAQDWSLSLSSNVELRTWKLSTKADKEEKGLGGASIKLLKGGAVINEVKSFPNGDFKIDIPGNGEFSLEVSYPGCNTKKFAISTLGVPADIAKDNFRPSYGIGGFIMARPLPGIDYSYLSQALVKVVYLNRGKFEDDNSITERSLKAVSKINDAENQLIEKFCSTNREGDAALSKPDCPLAKTLYEKAIGLIPGEAYPAQQLAKVGKCLQDKEAADKKAQEAAVANAAKAEAAKADAAKKDADKKVVEDAVAKAKADKAAKDQELNDKLAKAAEAEAKKKAAAEKQAAKKEPEAPKAAAANPPAVATTTVKPKSSIIKIKEKSEEDLEADKKRAGKAKSEAEDAEKIRMEEEKSDAKKAEKEKKYREHLAKEEADVQQKEEERRQKEKEHAKKEAEEEAVRAEEDRKKFEEREAKAKEEAKKEAEEEAKKAEEQRKKREEQEAKAKEEAKKEAEEEAVRAQQEQEARDKEEAERAAAEKEARKKRYEKIEENYNNGKSKSSYSIPPPLGSGTVFKDKVKKADDLFNKKQYAEARTVYEEALKLKPNDEYVTGKLTEISKLISPEPPKQQ
jgi:hypothetical protein